MSKTRQDITVTGRAANERIEAAIPVFKNRFGWATDQATAVAIRLESVGRLHGVGLIEGSTSPKGAARLATLALGVSSIPKRTRIKQEADIIVSSAEELRDALTVKPTKAAQKRVQRRTRARKK